MRSLRLGRGLGLIGTLALLGGAASLAAACGHAYGAAELPADAGPESGVEDGSVEGTTTDAASDAPGDAEAGPALDAVPPCPYDGGCPCNQVACQPTKLGSYLLSDTYGFANDSATLYVGAGKDGLNAIAFADGTAAPIYVPADATTKVTNIALSKNEIFLIEVPTATDPNIVAVSRAAGHASRVVVSQAHFNGDLANDLIAVNDTRVYWNQVQPETVKAALHDGGDVRSTNAFVNELVATPGALYTSSSGSIYRYSPDLSSLEAVAGPPESEGLAADGTSVFWAGAGSLNRAPAAFVTNAGAAVVSGTFIYEVVFGDDGFLYFHSSSSLFRCRLPSCDGGAAKLGAIPSGHLVAVAGGNAYVVVTAGAAGGIDIQRLPLHD